jgi:ABC-type molybdate transport system permease subunit
LSRGRRALLIVVVTTALVLTPLVLGGALLGLYVGGQVGYPGSVLAIAFSTAGFVVGMLVIWKVIQAVVGSAEKATGRPS